MARVVHFEMEAEDPERCKRFYATAFGWKLEKWEGPVEYWLITTGDDKEPGINGGLARRGDSSFAQPVINTIDVDSLDEKIEAVKANGGEIVRDKGAVPGVGWLAYAKDTEGNLFGMMEEDESAA